MNKWQKLCSYIDSNKVFYIFDLKNIGLDQKALHQYTYYLKRANFISKINSTTYTRNIVIDKLSFSKVKEIGWDLELDKVFPNTQQRGQ